MLGPHEAMFTRDAVDTLFASRFTVTPQSNRMGYRLEGPPLRHAGAADILSDATPIGSLQVPASGPADPADGRSADDGRISEDRHRHLG